MMNRHMHNNYKYALDIFTPYRKNGRKQSGIKFIILLQETNSPTQNTFFTKHMKWKCYTLPVFCSYTNYKTISTDTCYSMEFNFTAQMPITERLCHTYRAKI